MAENRNPLFNGYNEAFQNNGLKFSMGFESGIIYDPTDPRFQPYIDAEYEVVKENPMQIPEQKLLEDKDGDPVRR